jgi:hypothetical protein
LRELNETLEQRVQAETYERLQIWNVSQDLLVIADADGRFLNVNPAWTDDAWVARGGTDRQDVAMDAAPG